MPDLFELSRLVAKAEKTSDVLPQVVNLTRKLFIFDNLVIFLAEGDELTPYFARAVGRGRSKEADVAWGEEVARQIYQSGETTAKQEELGESSHNRLLSRFYLGIPLQRGNEKFGVVVFIRFGGPEYDFSQIRLAEFIAEHLSHLIEREYLLNRVNALEVGHRFWEMQEDFVATVSHDLKTPLGFIKGYTTTLLRKDTEWDRETYNEFLQIIDDETDRLQGLIDNLLDSSRLQSGTLQLKFQSLKLDVLIQEFINRAQMMDYDLEIELDLLDTDLMIQADPGRLGQVFDNLLSNANKYAPGSTVTVEVRKRGGEANVIFCDTGPGIKQDHLERIFQRFYRIPDARYNVRGSGLGLFICQQVIKAHHGRIYAESTLGEGSCFHIFLPLEKTTET